jgi:hypothetical protein
MKPCAALTFSVTQSNLGAWAPLFGGGIGISTQVGISLKEFLCDRLMIPGDYLEHRIQTILVNGRAVDDVAQVRIADGDVIALSAAMPGLAGATLRRGGHLAPMRAAISQKQTPSTAEGHRRGIVVLKLFNLVAKEIGSRLLSAEIWLKARDLKYLRDQLIIFQDPPAGTEPEEWIRLQPQVHHK